MNSIDLEKLVQQFCEEWWKEKNGLQRKFLSSPSSVYGKIFVDVGAIKSRTENFNFTQFGEARTEVFSVEKNWTNRSNESIQVDTKISQTKDVSIRCEQKAGIKVGGKNELKLNFQLPVKIGSISLDVSNTFENINEYVYESKRKNSSSTEDCIHFQIPKKTGAKMSMETKQEAVSGEFECTAVFSGMARFGLQQSNGLFLQGSEPIGVIFLKAMLPNSWVAPQMALALKNVKSAGSFDNGKAFGCRISGHMDVKTSVSSNVVFHQWDVDGETVPELLKTVEELQADKQQKTKQAEVLKKSAAESEKKLDEVLQMMRDMNEEDLPSAFKKFIEK